MMRSEIDLEAGTWIISKERTKNGKAHHIDLSPEAVSLISGGHDGFYHSCALVFSTTGYSAPSGFSKAKARLDKRMANMLGERFQPWRTHDLRRTAASGMAGLGYQPHVIERVLNHVSGVQGGLVGVYQRHQYVEERRAATLAWAGHIGELVKQGR